VVDLENVSRKVVKILASLEFVVVVFCLVIDAAL
jgi:hypothetical protein